MPCIPSWHEQLWMREGDAITTTANRLASQAPLLEKVLPVVSDALLTRPELAERPEAKDWRARAEAALVGAARWKDWVQSPNTMEEVDVRVAGKDGLRAAFAAVEQTLCEAGVLVFLAGGGTLAPAAPAVTVDSRAKELLEHHEWHRTSDRDAKLAELRAALAEVEGQFRSREEVARKTVYARGEFFDDATSREDAVLEEGGSELKALRDEGARLSREIERISALRRDELLGSRDLF